jgi:CO/xanthine dehydrogenase Mo-binding subunit
MTEMLNSHVLNRELSRTAFLKGGGAMIVGFSMLGAGFAAKASKAAGQDPFASAGPFDQSQIDSWIVVNSDNTITLKSGKIELGQGTSTGLMMIAAEELDVAMKQMRWTVHDTNVTPIQGGTWGSSGIQSGGPQVRAAAAAAKNALLDLAAKSLGVAKASLSVSDGVVSGGGKTATYGQLLGGKLFNVRIPGASRTSGLSELNVRLASGAPGTKPINQYKVVGKYRGRIDIPDKVSGKYTYLHNVKVPGMLHGRLVRPRGQGAYGKGTAPEILSIDEKSIRNIAGARVVRYKNFLGVVAPTEFAAIQAAAQLKVKWADPPTLPSVGNMFKQIRELDSAGKTPARIMVNTGNFDSAFNGAPIKASGSFKVHYQGGAAIGPECCVADVTTSGARILSNTQHAYSTRGAVQGILEVLMGTSAPPLEKVRVTYFEGGSTYGPVSPWADTALAAATMSALARKPVRLQLMRWDSHGWGHYSPQLLADVRGAVDANGKLLAMEYTGFGHAGFSTDATLQQVTGEARFGSSGAIDRNITGPQYNIPNQRNIGKTIPLEDTFFKTSALRAPNTVQAAFAYEQVIDELAYAAKMDPVEFRRRNLATTRVDPSQRWRFALDGAAKAANWQPRVAASNRSNGTVVKGSGVSMGTFANTRVAVIVDIEVNRKTGKIQVKDLYYGGDTGFVVYPDGAQNNEMGALLQGVSRGLYEQVGFNKKAVTSLDWVSYPVLRFVDAPRMHQDVASRTDVPINDTGATVAQGGSRSTGSGEPGLTAVPAAIANAFFDATGVRIREMPMSPARVRGVLQAAGRLAK